jgi:phosphoglycerol transferase MdoB-like AlkP superfamily enzyme
VQQTAISQATQSAATRSARAAALLTYVPFVLFFVWMVYKERIGLIASGIAPGPDMLAATAGALLVLSPWFFLSGRRRRMLGVALFDLVLTLILFADIVYFRQFGDLVSVASLRFAGQLGTVKDSVLHLFKPSDFWLWIDIPLLAILAFVPLQGEETWLGRMQQGGLRKLAAGALALLGALIVGAIAFIDPYLSAKYYGHSMVASRMGLINYHVFDIGNYLGRLTARMTPSGPSVAKVNTWFDRNRSQDPAAAPLFGAAKGKNVIMIQVESLQNFAVNLKVNGQEVMPNVARLARESMYWDDFYSETGQGVTSDADLLGNCSLHPTRTGAVYYDYAQNHFRCMPTVLRESGYKAVAFQGMPPDFWNLATVYPHVGFEKYYNIKDGLQLDEKIGIGLSDESFLRQTADQLKELPQPYEAFVVTLTSHGPFNFEGLPHELNLGSLEGTDAGNYLHAVHYTDKAIGHFIDRLRQDGALDNAVVLLYGDHGGVFRQNSGTADLLGFAPADEVNWTRMEKSVPFLIRLPGGAHAGVQPHVAGEADIAPTLAGLLGIHSDKAYFMGRNLLDQPEGIAPFYNGSAMNDQFLFWSTDSNPALGRCYERTTHQQVDVGQCVPLAQQAADRLDVSQLIVTRDLIPKLSDQK